MGIYEFSGNVSKVFLTAVVLIFEDKLYYFGLETYSSRPFVLYNFETNSMDGDEILTLALIIIYL